MPEMAGNIALDCKNYRADRPCTYRQRCRCQHYEPMGFRILIIKLAALGDVVRTTCLLDTLKRTYPQSHITWLTLPNGVRILDNHPLIDKCMPFEALTVITLTQQEFDLVICLDKEAEPAAVCNAVRSPDKRGMGLSKWGTVGPLNDECEPYFQLGLDDERKFHHNTKSYPQLIHEAVELEYSRQPYRLYCDQSAVARAKALFAPLRATTAGPIIALNTGAESVFANKAPRPSHWVEIARKLLETGYSVVLLGGPREAHINPRIADQLAGVYDTGCDNTEQQFVAIVDQCDLVITGDTLALHVALARSVPVVALFGPTCQQEIDLFGMGRKIISNADCAPCYRRQCNKRPNCMDRIPAEQVVAAAEHVCKTTYTTIAAATPARKLAETAIP